MKRIANLFRNKTARRILIGALLIIAVVSVIFYRLKTENRVQIDTALIQAPVTAISPEQGGKLISVDVNEGDYVKKGQQLATVGSNVLRAFSDGEVISVNRQVGAMMTPQTAVIQTVNFDDLRVVGTIDENKGLIDVKDGQVVSFTVDALPGQTFWGYVDRTGESAKQTQVAFSVSSERPTQQFEVFGRFDAFNNRQIKNGMSAKMTVYTK